MNGLIITKARARVIDLLLLFAFCQVMGVMCAMPDLSFGEDLPQLAGEMSDAACAMDDTIMCPPSATSSPERHIKNSTIADVDAAQIVATGATIPVSPSAQPIECVGSAYSIVPISIAFPSVLRI